MNQVKSRVVLVASTLFWVWGVLVLLVGFAVAYPAFAIHGELTPLIAVVALGSTTCMGGFALRQRQWGVRWWGALLSLVTLLALMTVKGGITWLGIAINAAAFIAIVVAWKELGAKSDDSSPA